MTDQVILYMHVELYFPTWGSGDCGMKGLEDGINEGVKRGGCGGFVCSCCH